MSDYADHPELPPARHERRDVPPRVIVIGIGLFLLCVAVIVGLIPVMFPGARKDKPDVLPVPSFPYPRLQTNPREDMTVFYRTEMQRLNSAGWVDRAHGIVHMPISDAMRRIAQEGIPDWPRTPPAVPQR